MEVIIFCDERNERYQMQRKLLGVPSTFGTHCSLASRAHAWTTCCLAPWTKACLFVEDPG